MRVLAFLLAGAISPPSFAASGTEFWAVLSQENDPGFPNTDLNLFVGNPDPSSSATVTIETESGVVATATVAPLATHVFRLGGDRKVYGSMISRRAYRVTSDRPVDAYQYMKTGGTNETGALLIDRRALGRAHLVLGYPGDSADSWPERTGVVTIVSPGPTRVTVVPSAATQSGPMVPALAAGTSFEVDLDAFDVLQLGASEDTGDLTGTSVISTGPVEVFAGCIYCHIGNSVRLNSGADNVQELIPPESLWGSTIVAVASNPLTVDINVWRILASEDGTDVLTAPPVPGSPFRIDRGEFVEFESTIDFTVTSSSPVLVGRYNSGGITPICGGGCPDPALALMVPIERFFTKAVFFMSTESFRFSLIDIVSPPGATVVLDGQVLPVSAFIPVGSSGFNHAQLRLSNAGTHVLESDLPIAAYAADATNSNAASFPVGMANFAPTCDPGCPCISDCTGPVTDVPLDGTRSSDPEGGPLIFRWSSASPEVSFDDPTSGSPTATVSGIGTFQVDLLVDDGANQRTCSTTIEVRGDASVPPEVSDTSSPFLLVRRGGDIEYSWQDFGSAPVSYNFYEGGMRLIDSHVPLACNVAGSLVLPNRREATLTPVGDNRYFLVSAANCAAEGPTGMSPGQSACPP